MSNGVSKSIDFNKFWEMNEAYATEPRSREAQCAQQTNYEHCTFMFEIRTTCVTIGSGLCDSNQNFISLRLRRHPKGIEKWLRKQKKPRNFNFITYRVRLCKLFQKGFKGDIRPLLSSKVQLWLNNNNNNNNTAWYYVGFWNPRSLSFPLLNP
jgi:hypothetical protein